MTCTECPRTIHPERLAALPRAVTCSSGCSRKRQLRKMAEGSNQAYHRRRAREKAAELQNRKPIPTTE